MAMDIKGFVRKNTYLRFIDLETGWEKPSGTGYYEMPGRMLVSDVRNDDTGELRGIALVRTTPLYAFVDTMNLTAEQARELHEAIGLLLEDDTRRAGDDGEV